MLKTVFLGTPDFSVPTVSALLNNPNVDLKYIVSNPDRKSGRGQKLQSPPVISFAKEHNIAFFQTAKINKEKNFITELEKLDIDLFIVLAFSQFLGNQLLKIPKKGSYNIHTSLLPKYRGAAPIQYALLNGDKETGVSIQKMVKKMDAGDICYSKKVSIDPGENGETLYNKLKQEAAVSCNNFIKELISGKLEFTKQDESLVSFAPIISKKDGLLDFSNSKVEEIINKSKAYYPWPGTFTYLNGKILKIHKVEKSPIKLNPGEVSTQFQSLNIGCLNGSIRIVELQLEGKKPTTDKDLLNGNKGELRIGS